MAQGALQIGYKFAEVYYGHLASDPSKLLRLYAEKAHLLHGWEGKSAPLAHGLAEIKNRLHEVWMGGNRLRLTLVNIDAQPSLKGIVIQATGSVEYTGDVEEHGWHPRERRDFCQTFFLIPLRDSFFVYNDVFRFLSDDEDHVSEDTQVEAEIRPSSQMDVKTDKETKVEKHEHEEKHVDTHEKPVEKHAEKYAEKPVEKHMEKPAGKNEKPVEKHVEKPAEKHEEKPIEKHAEKPVKEEKPKPDVPKTWASLASTAPTTGVSQVKGVSVPGSAYVSPPEKKENQNRTRNNQNQNPPKPRGMSFSKVANPQRP
jgi:hypothetical protein